MRKAILFLIISMLFSISNSAEIPKTINYQGKLTDDVGTALTGTADLTFKIYSCESCNYTEDILWEEVHSSVPLSNGLFNVVLYDIPDTAFSKPDRWLGITVNTDPELTPRTKFNSVAYSYRALHADTLENDIYLDETGDELTGNLNLGNGGVGGNIEIGANFSNLNLKSNNNTKNMMYGDLFGQTVLFDDDNTPTVNISAGFSGGGELELKEADGTPSIELNAGGSSADGKVIFPDSSINSDEILNEVGFARQFHSMVTLATTSTNITSVDITIPAPGYVLLFGRCEIYLNGTTVDVYVILNINSATGAAIENFQAVVTSQAGVSHRHPVMTDAVFYHDAAGTYTYTFDGLISEISGTNYAMNITLTALYIPTSYDAVAAMVSDPDGFPDAEPIPVYDIEGNSTGETKYKVDLRQLELKAKEAKIRALEAELELQKALETERRKLAN